MEAIVQAITSFFESTGFAAIFSDPELAITLGDSFSIPGGKVLVMYIIIGALFYLGIVKKFEPLLLIPIATGMLLANVAFGDVSLFHSEFFYPAPGSGATVPGITETLKAENQMLWVGRMNALRSAVTETVNTEVIFV